MARIYAAPGDLPEDLRDAAHAPELLRRASNLVTKMIRNAVFRTDGDGMPMGDDLEACRDAVVMQVSTWLSTGVNPITGHSAKPKTISSKGSNGTTVAYVPDAAGAAFWTSLADGQTLIPEAFDALDAQGLTRTVLASAGRGRMYRPVPSPDTLIDGGER